jgi:predicted DNA-binding transcriptional regulator YafY
MSETGPGGPNRPLLRRLLRYREWLVGGRGFTARQAVEELEVCERTVYRDIAYLRTLGWDVEFCRSRRRWLMAGEAAPLPLVSLREPEVMALLIAEEALRGCEAAPFAAALRTALEKLSPLLDTPVNPESTRRLVPRFVGPPARALPGGRIEHLLLACQNCKRLDISYFSLERNAVERRRVDPYRLVFYAGEAFLIGFDLEQDGFRTFALGQRMRVIDETGETFAPDADFDLERYLETGFQHFHGGKAEEVVLRFRATIAPYLKERIWHATEVKEDLPGGGLLLRMRVPINAGVLRFVLQYGAEVEVLAPEALRRQVAETHGRAIAAYASGSGERQ